MDENNHAVLVLALVFLAALGGLGFLALSGSTGQAVRGSDTIKPVFVSGPNVDAKVGEFYTYDAMVRADVPPLQFSLQKAPAGMLIDKDSGVVTWTPQRGQDGQANVRIMVLDGMSRSSEQSFVVYVSD